MDLVRRRRWHRKMIAEKPGIAPVFNNQRTSSDKSDDEDDGPVQTVPRMFLSCPVPYKYQLRAYIYQARDLSAGDKSGFSDPFAQAVFLSYSQKTEKIKKTLSPTWDQTLMFEEVTLHESPESLKENPPEIVIEVYDHEKYGNPEFMGRVITKPKVKITKEDFDQTAVLSWMQIYRGDAGGGEMLAAFDLFLISDDIQLPVTPPKKGSLYIVPNGIRPILKRTAVEVLCWGVRDMKGFQLAPVSSPSVQFSIGSHIIKSEIIRNTKKNPNFQDPVLFIDSMLPEEEKYTPPISVRIKDNRQFGRRPTVGVCSIDLLDKYRCNAVPAEGLQDLQIDIPGLGSSSRDAEHVITMDNQDVHLVINENQNNRTSLTDTAPLVKDKKEESSSRKSGTPEKDKDTKDVVDDVDWWSKYYASCGDEEKAGSYLKKGYGLIDIYDTELEKAKDFYNDFTDFCDTFPLRRGKTLEEEESDVVGNLKASFRMYQLPEDPSEDLPCKIFSGLPPSEPEECLIRVYIIKAIDLQPKDQSGLADPYVSVRVGKKKITTEDNYQPNTLNPVFGQMLEFTAMLPLVTEMKVKILDHDLVGADDLIGETIIDLENRYFTKFRATCGIPKSYSTYGVNQWRDNKTPKVILAEYCQRHNIPEPIYYGTSGVKLGNRVYNIGDFENNNDDPQPYLGEMDERLALHILQHLKLVHEHVETRTLYNPIQPGIPQGKLQMWIDIFNKSSGTPGQPVDITPRQPNSYELRCVIWNTKDVVLQETSITGEQMSDIYVKGWLAGINDKQRTDVHYRSLDGEGNFNWRFLLPFKYIPAEEVIVIENKEHFWSLDTTEQRVPPQLVLQIWDNDKFSKDDFLGEITLDLHCMPEPAKNRKQCTLAMHPDVKAKSGSKKKAWSMKSLFMQKRMYGWWPCYSRETDEKGQPKLAGKIEMELEVVTGDEIDQRPAGKGRNEPNMNPKLEEPQRPATSFLWFASPLKTFRHIIWRNYKWWIIFFIFLILFIVFIILFFYSFPSAAVNKLFKTF